MNENNKNKSITAVTTASLTTKGYDNIRTSIPSAIVEALGIKQNDRIVWHYKDKKLSTYSFHF